MFGTSYPISAFGGSAAQLLAGACFAGALVAACVWDVRRRRIPNQLVLLIALLGVTFSVVTQPIMIGVTRSLLGLGLGFALWIPFYALGMLGAGDVKLFASACCWLAPSQIFVAAVLSAFAGGVLSVVALVLAHGARFTAFRLAHAARQPSLLARSVPIPAGRKTLPYGLAMAVGLLLAICFPRLLGSI